MSASSHHKPNWLGKPSAEMRAEAQAIQDAQPIVTSCLFCGWRYVGLVGAGRDAARTHRELKHPEAAIRKPRKSRRIAKRAYRSPAEEEQARVDAAELNRVRAERELAEMLAKVERGRLRRGEAA